MKEIRREDSWIVYWLIYFKNENKDYKYNGKQHRRVFLLYLIPTIKMLF